MRIAQRYISYDVLRELAPFARSYLCVGVQEGECLMHVLRSNPRIERLALCDTWGYAHGGTGRGSHEHVAAKLDALGWEGRVQWLDGDSKALVKTLAEEFDLSYVDGSHEESDALADFQNVWLWTVGAMVCHDVRMPAVWSAMTRFLDSVEADVRIASAGTGTAVVFR